MAARQQATAPAMSFVSFKPTDFSASGILPEGDYLIEKVRVVQWDYDGKAGGAQTIAALFSLRAIMGGKPADGEASLQYYSAGDPLAFTPNEDGTKMVATSTRSQLSKSSNYFTFVENAVNAGFPEDKIEDDFTVWEGMVAHFIQIPQQKRDLPQSNLVQGGNAQAKQDRTLPVISIIHKLPWEAAKAGKAAAAAPKPAAAAPKATAKATPAPAAASNGDSTDLVQEHLATVLQAEGVPLARTKARVGTFKAMNTAGVDPAARDAAMKVFGDDAALENILAVIGDGHALDGANIVSVG